MSGRVPTIIPGVILLLADFADWFRLHETTRWPAAQLRHLLYFGNDGNVRAGQRAILTLHQHRICEGHDNVRCLPWQSLVLVPLATKLSTSVIFLAANTHGKFTFRVWHIKGPRHSRGENSADLRTANLLGRNRSGHPRRSVGEWLRRCHHGGKASACCPRKERHHCLSLRGETEPGTGGWVLIAGVPHAHASCGHATHNHRRQGWDWLAVARDWRGFARSGFSIRGQLRVGVVDRCQLLTHEMIQASSRQRETVSGL
mmetsp:Transcript_14732/g.32005  ORF Transcript_14732/g.32005 Transcript_14732/m.32005 type:complete len:258 (-) Transcript_14732:97-870(-)